MKASDLFVQALEKEGVEYIFGIPGEENLDFINSLSRSSIKLIVTRHEQAAGFMAATYGRKTGKPGVCLSTLGPGATNLVTAAAYAQLGGMPIVMITGQKPIKHSKQGQFQIIDVVEMMRPLTKFTRQIVDGSRIPAIVREAFRLAAEEKPGACHIELPEDVAREEVDSVPMEIHQVRRPRPDKLAIKQACEMILKAKAPLLLVGAAANRKRTSRALVDFVDKTGIPFFNTQMGVGVIDERHPLYLGTAALSSGDIVHRAVEHADLIINVGHDIVEKPPFLMQPGKTKVLHVNFFSARVDEVYFPQLELVGDIANSMQALTRNLVDSLDQASFDFDLFMQVKAAGERLIAAQAQIATFPVTPPRLVADIRAALPSDGIVTLDNGLYKLWFARNYRAHMPNTLLLDNALATMGAGLPSAIAAKMLNPHRQVISVSGDGGFMMNAQELETAIRLGLDLVVLVLNDNAYGMIKWKQAEMGQASFGLDFSNPDFVQLAQAHGAKGYRVQSTESLRPLIEKCLSQPGVHVIDVPFEYDSTNIASIIEETSLSSPIQKETLTVKNPSDGSTVATVACNTAADLEEALSAAQALYLDRDRWLAPHERIAILERLAELMMENRQFLIDQAVKEGGKPYKDTVIEIDRAIQGVKLGIGAIHNLKGEEVPMGLSAASTGRLAFTTREPIGVVVSLSAFNHPLNLIVHQTIPALAAGSPVIVKPAAATPLSCLSLVELMYKAGLPRHYCQALILDNSLAEKLATDSRVAYLSFIGSAKVGWYLRSKLAPGTRCALEHGGVAPVIVDIEPSMPPAEVEDFLDKLVPPLSKGAFYHAGQVCVSVKRIYLPQAHAARFAEKLAEAAAKLKVGKAEDKDTDIGPLIRESECDRVHAWVSEATSEGAVILTGGKKAPAGANYYLPTVLLNPHANSKVSQLETFGPLVCIYGYEDIASAIASANSLSCAFQAAVFGKDMARLIKCATALNATAVMINDHTAFRVDWMPFGGRKESGLGMGGIYHSALEMSQEKLMVLKYQ